MKRRNPITLAMVVLCGCGGASAKYTVDDVSLASVPMSEKQPMFAAEQDVSMAKAERQKALTDIDNTKHEIAVADTEHEQHKLEVQKAKLGSDAAEKSRDMNQVQAATNQRHVAELGERAALAKLDTLDQKVKWQKALVDVADERIDDAMAKVELEKAKLAAAKNILPSKDFKLENFVNEVAKRDKAVDQARATADGKKAKMDTLAQQERDLNAQYEQQKASPGSPVPAAGSPAAAPPPVR